MFGVTTSIILDTRKKRKDEKFPVKLRLIYQRIPKYYPLGINLTEEEWGKVYGEKPRKEYKDFRLLFEEVEGRANKIVRSLPVFSFESFQKAFNNKLDLSQDVLDLFTDYIEQLRINQQHGTADSYSNAKGSFKAYIESKNRKRLNFGDVTPEWLHAYEKWMLDRNKSITTVGIYTRSFRRIINRAIEVGVFNKDFYPFGKSKYQIPGGRNIKKALTHEEVGKIHSYHAISDEEDRARDMWMISYLCNGANFKDLAYLRYKNISQDSLVFIREKTKRTTRADMQPVIVGLTPEIKVFIKKRAIDADSEDAFVFGVIDGSETEEVQRAKIKQATKVINKYTKRIGESLDLPLKLTLGVARHSWATIMKNFGANDEYIGDGLGHQNLTTTKNYLGSFEDKIRADYQSKLLKF